MNIYTIYKATNLINNKCYIGFDSKFPKRKQEHKNASVSEDTVFYRAIRKYGWDNFEWEILYQSKDKNHTKNEMENYFIVEYNSFIHFKNSSGYNMTLGGEGLLGNRPTKQTMKKIRNTWKEKYGENITNVFQLNFVKEKSKETCIKEYGYEHASKNPEIKKKIKETNIKKYGVDHLLKLPEFQEKRKEMFTEKYGVNNPSKLPFLSIISTRKTYAKNIISTFYPEFKQYY